MELALFEDDYGDVSCRGDGGATGLAVEQRRLAEPRSRTQQRDRARRGPDHDAAFEEHEELEPRRSFFAQHPPGRDAEGRPELVDSRQLATPAAAEQLVAGDPSDGCCRHRSSLGTTPTVRRA